MRHTAAVIPALNAERTIASVVRSLRECWSKVEARPVIVVVDDGSTDRTGAVAREAGALVIEHECNRGKGLAIRTGMQVLRSLGFTHALTLDADGQHPADQAVRIARWDCDPKALVLGVRDLAEAGAPSANRFSNGLSNFFLSAFSGQRLFDTQCGLRSYPIEQTLALDAHAEGFAFEAEVLLLASKVQLPLVQVPVRVLYPPERRTHFHSVRDPARIVGRVLCTLGRHPNPLPLVDCAE